MYIFVVLVAGILALSVHLEPLIELPDAVVSSDLVNPFFLTTPLALLLRNGDLMAWNPDDRTLTKIKTLHENTLAIAYDSGRLVTAVWNPTSNVSVVGAFDYPCRVSWMRFPPLHHNLIGAREIIVSCGKDVYRNQDIEKNFSYIIRECAISMRTYSDIECTTIESGFSIAIPYGLGRHCNKPLYARGQSISGSARIFPKDGLTSISRGNLPVDAKELQWHGSWRGALYLSYLDARSGKRWLNLFTFASTKEDL